MCSITNTAVTPSSRDKHIDTIKFLLIFSIFIFHMGDVAGKFYPLVNIYQVPIFFIISGFWALNHIEDKSLGKFICNAFKRYLIYWIFWVFMFSAYYTIRDSLSIRQSLDVFIHYFSSVKATGISGMWFTPAFFFTSLIYFLFAKTITKFFRPSKTVVAWVAFAFFFAIYFATKYFWKIPVDLIFSLGFVPECLLYFSLGTVVYIYICACKPILKTSLILKISNCFLTLFAFANFLLFFFNKQNLLWGWTSTALGGKLSFLPEFATVLLMYFLLSSIARCISCDFTAKIGRNTLGLCHCEIFTKEMLMYAGSLLGISFKPTRPIETVIFAFVALIVSCHLVIPVTDTATKRIMTVFTKQD